MKGSVKCKDSDSKITSMYK